jgi:hypothetical protein
MRLFEVEPQYGDFDAFMETVERECSWIWSVYKNTDFLYRGIRDSRDTLVKPIRTDRTPTDMDPKRHAISIAAYKQMGIAAHRGNSIFCTPDLDIAEGWGEPYIVFPANPFKFSYFLNWQNFVQTYLADLDAAMPTGNIAKYPYFLFTYLIGPNSTVDETVEYLQAAGLASTGLPMAINNGLEVLITGEKYYAVSINYEDEVRAYLDS